ncbi:MAG: hypothetical protein Q4D63_03460 [Neisseria animaloris]|uniref:hypothetical protein n=1 Tax=Neisseria animaloris TaxID=326522 RepID=UPI00131EA830|nr:hypothetical protein [Neisseria animaloris]MDO5073438.1 hypothetical protein [Neisseria animaloris]
MLAFRRLSIPLQTTPAKLLLNIRYNHVCSDHSTSFSTFNAAVEFRLKTPL